MKFLVLNQNRDGAMHIDCTENWECKKYNPCKTRYCDCYGGCMRNFYPKLDMA